MKKGIFVNSWLKLQGAEIGEREEWRKGIIIEVVEVVGWIRMAVVK